MATLYSYFKKTNAKTIDSDCTVKSIQEVQLPCKNCKRKGPYDCGSTFINQQGEQDICTDCDKEMKYYFRDIKKDCNMFVNSKRCSVCNFNMSYIHHKDICLWCFDTNHSPWDGMKIVNHTLYYGKYTGKTHAYALCYDLEYCKSRLPYTSTKLSVLTKNMLCYLAAK